MKCTGILKEPYIDFTTGKMIIAMQVNEDVREHIQKYMDKPGLDIEIKIHRERRSRNANAYFHVLSGEIAEALTISKAKSKNMLICKYGQPQLLPDGSMMVYKTNAPEEFMWEQESIHCIPVKYGKENGNDITFYKVYRGSHTYNTYEMSKLIDGTVADAKELGIETMTPAELERMLKAWQNG